MAKRRNCDKCGKELFDMGIQMEGLGKPSDDGMHPECALGFLKYLVSQGAKIPFFSPSIPLEEQKKMLDDPEFLDALETLASGTFVDDPRCHPVTEPEPL